MQTGNGQTLSPSSKSEKSGPRHIARNEILTKHRKELMIRAVSKLNILLGKVLDFDFIGDL